MKAYEFKRGNNPNILYAYYRGVYLGRLWLAEKPSKKSKKPAKYTIIDRDQTTAIQGSRAWSAMRTPATAESQAELLRLFKKSKKVASA